MSNKPTDPSLLKGRIHISREEVYELERIAEAMDGPFWRAIERKIHTMIEESHRMLVDSEDDRAIARAQGATLALRRVLELPAIIRKEARLKEHIAANED